MVNKFVIILKKYKNNINLKYNIIFIFPIIIFPLCILFKKKILIKHHDYQSIFMDNICL